MNRYAQMLSLFGNMTTGGYLCHMQKKSYKQTGIRLPEELIAGLKRKARNKGLSFNAYVETVLRDDLKEEIPVIDTSKPIAQDLLASVYPPLPSEEEINADPRLQAILGL